MKTIDSYIIEKLVINKKVEKQKKIYQPASKEELRTIIEKLLEERKRNANLNDIDTSKITDMSELFKNLNIGKINISEWDVSNVTNMHGMFRDCRNFNCDLSSWDVSNVEDMQTMFFFCPKFEAIGLDSWNVSKVKNMIAMFSGCRMAKADIEKWDVSSLEKSKWMLTNCGIKKPSWYKE